MVDSKSEHLTKRELEILELLVSGDSTKQIASKLGITFKTAASHRASIMGKMGVHETASLVREAILSGLVPLQWPNNNLTAGC
jgi:DNA-binding CsgD family transcriptional regulator